MYVCTYVYACGVHMCVGVHVVCVCVVYVGVGVCVGVGGVYICIFVQVYMCV